LNTASRALQDLSMIANKPCRRSSIANGLRVLLVVVKLVTICRCILHMMHCSGHRTSPATTHNYITHKSQKPWFNETD